MIDTATWDDPWFSDLEPDAKLVFLYLLTNRRSTAAGAFEITIRAMEFETGIASTRIRAILEEFGERVRWWPDHQVIWVRNFYRHQAANEKFTISAQRHVAALPVDVQRVIATVYPILVPDGVLPDPDTHTNGYAMGIASKSKSREGSDRDSGEDVSVAGATDSPPSDDPPTPDPPKPEPIPKPQPGKPMPRNGPAQTMLAVLHEDVLKIGPPTNYGQAVKQAQRLADAGCTTEELERIAYWLLADSWHADKGITITTVINSRDKWKSSQNAPRTAPNGSMSIVRGGQNGKVGRDGLTDEERGWRENPGPKGWTADEAMRMSIAMEQQERRERNSA